MTTIQSKKITLAKTLRQHVEVGQWQPGQRVPAERAIAEQFGVSRITARAAVEQLIDDGWLERRPRCRPTVAHRPPPVPAAETLRVTVLHRTFFGTDDLPSAEVDPAYHWYLSQLYEGLGQGFRGQAVQVNLLAVPAWFDVIDFLADRTDPPPHGVITHNLRLRGDQIDRLQQQGAAVVGMSPPEGPPRISFADVDNVAGMYQATRHLLAGGRTRVGLAGLRDLWYDHDRLAGYLKAHQDRRIDVRPGLHPMIAREPDPAAVADMVGRWLDDRACDGLIVNRHPLVRGVYEAIRSRGLRIGSDIPVICYDDYPGFEHLVSPSPTALVQPFDRVAAAAAELLLQRIRQPLSPIVQRLIAPVFVSRQSG